MADTVEILYEEGPCFVVNKPTGLLTQAPAGIDSLEIRFKEFLKLRENKSGNVYVGVPHRLDRPASGAIMFARHVRAARRLSEQFVEQTIEKKYWACVEGIIEPAEGVWHDTMRKVPDEARAELVEPTHPDARVAELKYRVVGQSPHGSWLEIDLKTGRTHQIRLQAAARGFPVLGDTLYGSTVTFGPQFADDRLRAIALHARSLKFQHPMTREDVYVEAPVPEPWLPLIDG